jgi:hypothetical protein
MKLLLLISTIALTSFSLAAEPNARPKEHPPIELKPRQIVTEEDTRKAEELLRDLPTLTPAAAAMRLAELLKDRDIPRHTSGPWFELIARVGGPRELQQVYVGLVTSLPDDCCEGGSGPDFDPTFAFREDSEIRSAAEVLIRAAETRGVLPASPYQDGKLHLGNHIYFRGPEGMVDDLTRLAGFLHVVEDYERLVDLLRSPEAHRGACEGLVTAGKDAIPFVEPACLELDEPLKARGALLVLSHIAPERAVKHTARILSAPMAEEELAYLWTQLLGCKPFAERLTAETPWYLPLRVREAGAKVARTAKLSVLAEKLAPAEESILPPTEFEAMAGKVRAEGDPMRGELVFRGDVAACSQCHALGGIASREKVGPDLGRIGAGRTLAEILSDTLQPHARIAKGYELFHVTSDERTVLPGTSKPFPKDRFLTRPNPLPAGTNWPPAGAKPRSGSAMPTGLTDALSAREKSDLFAFLSKLGAPGGIDASNRHTARVWRIESESEYTPGDFLTREGKTGGTSEIHSLLNGNLRRDDCEETLYDTDRKRPFYVGTRFTVKAEGEVRFQLTGLDGVWIDGQRIERQDRAEITIPLKAGTHRIDTKLEIGRMPEAIRISSASVEFEGNSIWDWKH